MNPNLRFLDYPISAGMTHGARRWDRICDLLEEMPKSIRDMLASAHSASFIRGLYKLYKLPPEQGQTIAYAVLQVALGEKTLAQLSGRLAAKLPLPEDSAQKMAAEIEQDLMRPVRKDLERYWQRRPSSQPTRKASSFAKASSYAKASDDKSDDQPTLKELRPAGKSASRTGKYNGARNVLDLKKEQRPPTPPPMPRRGNS